MAAAPEREEGPGPRPRPALDLTVSSGNTTISLKIDDPPLARHALTGIGIGCGVAADIGIGCGVALAVLFCRQPGLVTSAVTQALEGPGLQVGNITPGSILVKLYCETKESFLSFMKDFKNGKVKQRLKEEFDKIGYKEELEVTISNFKEVNKKLHQIRSTSSRFTQKKKASKTEFVEVPKDLKSHVIGKSGRIIKDIMKSSGAFIETRKDEEGFTVISGDKAERECAKRLILKKVQEIQKKNYDRAPSDELVEIPSEYKRLIMGRGNDNLRHISTQTGAKVICKKGEVYIVSGTEEERQRAKVHIKVDIAGARMRGLENEFVKSCTYIDDWNLPKDCELKLEPVEQEDRMVHPGWHAQYRLKPAEDYEPQASFTSGEDPTYLSKLESDVLESLRKIKQKMKTKEYLKADMWCHFGRAIIRGPEEDEVEEGEWTIEEATKRFQVQNEGNFWRTAFKEGVNLDEKILEGIAPDKTPDEYVDYVARYDLAFLTPCGNQIRFKVWITKKNTGKKLEGIPVPFSDVKSILDEIHFEDELTRSRCRGWLVLPPRRNLQADILFPGCEFDCRLNIRGRIMDSALVTDYVPNEEERQTLAKYLSELTLPDGDGFEICLPKTDTPEGFYLIHKRCSERSLYETSPGFDIILSKENSWRSDLSTEESRETTDLYLHCREWDKLLNSGEWEPEQITARLPEFFQFVKEVQGFVLREMKTKTET